MTNADPELPLVGRVESAALQLVLTRTPASGDRRIEDWIASNLDMDSDPERANHWNLLIANLPAFRRRPAPRRNEGTTIASSGGWARFQVAYKRGFTMVRIVDQALVQQSHIEELGRDLMDLIAVGNYRLVLNFTAVERLGSWIIGVVGNAHRRCAAADGGKLKLCGLDPQLAEIFSIVGMARELDLHPNEAAAIDSPWPARSAPRQLPVDILLELGTLDVPPPLCGGAPKGRAEVADRGDVGSGKQPADSSPRAEAIAGGTVSLVVQVGRSNPRIVVVSATRWLIGRDRPCQLRFGSAQVSKQHAALEQRGGRVFLRDLGSTNGTLINGRHIRDLEVEVRHEDQFQIGPVVSTLLIGPAREQGGLPESLVREPTNGVDPASSIPQGELPSTEERPQFDELDPAGRIKFEIIEDVLVVTPRLPELDDEATLEVLRSSLQSHNVEQLPRRVVVNLEFVDRLSRQAIALLLAHHVRLEWAGGALRICQAHARIIALLDQVRLTALIDCYPTLDESVLAAWTSTNKDSLAEPTGGRVQESNR